MELIFKFRMKVNKMSDMKRTLKIYDKRLKTGFLLKPLLKHKILLPEKTQVETQHVSGLRSPSILHTLLFLRFLTVTFS